MFVNRGASLARLAGDPTYNRLESQELFQRGQVVVQKAIQDLGHQRQSTGWEQSLDNPNE